MEISYLLFMLTWATSTTIGTRRTSHRDDSYRSIEDALKTTVIRARSTRPLTGDPHPTRMESEEFVIVGSNATCEWCRRSVGMLRTSVNSQAVRDWLTEFFVRQCLPKLHFHALCQQFGNLATEMVLALANRILNPDSLCLKLNFCAHSTHHRLLISGGGSRCGSVETCKYLADWEPTKTLKLRFLCVPEEMIASEDMFDIFESLEVFVFEINGHWVCSS